MADKIYIITAKCNFWLLPSQDANICLVDENTLVEGLTLDTVKRIVNNHLSNRNYGWYFQQFLKLGFALSEYAQDEFLVWDADTVPLVPLSFHNEKGQILILPKKEHHRPYFETIQNLFPTRKFASYSFISEHMLFKVHIVREMLACIEKNSSKGYKWYEQCIAARQQDVLQVFSEFETYGTYCLNYHPNVLEPRHLKTFRHGGKIYGVMASRKEIESLSFDLETVSFEIGDYPISWGRHLVQWILYMGCRIITKLR